MAHQLILMPPDQGEAVADWTEMEPEWHLVSVLMPDPTDYPIRPILSTWCGMFLDPQFTPEPKPGTLGMVTCEKCLDLYRAEHPEGQQAALFTEVTP